MYIEQFEKSMYDLICETSTNLPKDVRRKILAARQQEDAGTRAAMSLDTIAQNINMADEKMSPICQDTGMPTFKIKTPVGVNQLEIDVAMSDKNIEAFTSFSPIYRWSVTTVGDLCEVRLIDLRYRSKGYYPFVAVAHVDKDLNVVNSYTGWIFSEDKLRKKLNFAPNS